jgi:hypothetical protein
MCQLDQPRKAFQFGLVIPSLVFINRLSPSDEAVQQLCRWAQGLPFRICSDRSAELWARQGYRNRSFPPSWLTSECNEFLQNACLGRDLLHFRTEATSLLQAERTVEKQMCRYILGIFQARSCPQGGRHLYYSKPLCPCVLR